MKSFFVVFNLLCFSLFAPSFASAMEDIGPNAPSLYQNQDTFSRIVSDFEKLKQSNESLYASKLETFEKVVKTANSSPEVQAEFTEIALATTADTRSKLDEIFTDMDSHLRIYQGLMSREDQPILVEKIVVLAEADSLMARAAVDQRTYYYFRSYNSKMSVSFELYATVLASSIDSRYWFQDLYYSMVGDSLWDRQQLSLGVALGYAMRGNPSKQELRFLEPSLTAFLPTQKSFDSFLEKVNGLIALLDESNPEDRKVITSLEEVRANALKRLKYYDSALEENDPETFGKYYDKDPELRVK